ncbi:hypothetical protein ACH4E8_17880 [Streptomyces sp. NPDC017979]|uniref:hypothetical protein n=1 Tax=Streptomyces sp. NPDC017979 TaxID=3365024 RepID=UPI003788A719
MTTSKASCAAANWRVSVAATRSCAPSLRASSSLSRVRLTTVGVAPSATFRLHDEYLRRPDLVRLATWTRMERRPAGHLVETHHLYDDRKLTAIAEAQAAGRVREGDPFDIMAVVIAMAMAWSPVSNVYAASDQEPAEAHARRRGLRRECVRSATAPGGAGTPVS